MSSEARAVTRQDLDYLGAELMAADVMYQLFKMAMMQHRLAVCLKGEQSEAVITLLEGYGLRAAASRIMSDTDYPKMTADELASLLGNVEAFAQGVADVRTTCVRLRDWISWERNKLLEEVKGK